MSHTPAPWFDMTFGPEVCSDGQANIIVSCSWPDVIEVCSMGNALTAGVEEKQANARLIATAPDLLEALKAVVHAYEHGGMIAPILLAQAAIAKAEGRS